MLQFARWGRGLIAAACLLLSSCSPPTAGETSRPLAIAVASDLQYAFEEIMLDFHRIAPQVQVRPTFGSSGSLFAQISNGAPFDMFLAADVDYVKKLADQSLADPNSIFVYGKSQLVVWVRSDSKLLIDQEGIRAVLDPAVKKVAIANPKHSPYGRSAEAALKNLGIYEQISEKIVLGENVAQAAQFVESGSADVGIIAKTLALAPPMRAAGRFAEVPADAAPQLTQGGAIMTSSHDRVQCEQIREYLISPRGRTILSEYGLLPPQEP